VIGVILMVAITVILAALIGSFVLGVGDDLDETPRAGIEVVQDSDSVRLTVINSGNLDDAQIVGPKGGKSMRFEESLSVGTRIIIDRRGFNKTASEINATPPPSDVRSEVSSGAFSSQPNDDLVLQSEECLIRHGAQVVYGVEINGSDIGCSGKILQDVADQGGPVGTLQDPDFAGSEIEYEKDAEYQFIGIKGSSSTVIRRIRSGNF